MRISIQSGMYENTERETVSKRFIGSSKQDDLYVKNLDTISGEEIVLFVDMNSKTNSIDDFCAVEEDVIDFSASIMSQLVGRGLSIKVFLNASHGRYFELADRPGFNKLMDFLLSQKSDGTAELFQSASQNEQNSNCSLEN